MKVIFRWKACNHSKSIENFIIDKASEFKHFNFLNQNVKFEIIHYQKWDIFKVRINLAAKTSKKILRAEAGAKNIYTAINNAFIKIEDQIRKVKTKIINRRSVK